MDFIHNEDYCKIFSKCSNRLNVDILQIDRLPELVNMRVILLQLSSECVKS